MPYCAKIFDWKIICVVLPIENVIKKKEENLRKTEYNDISSSLWLTSFTQGSTLTIG